MKIQYWYDIHNVLYNTMYQRSDFTVLSVETIISADNVHCDVRGEGEEGCDVKIINLMPHAKRSMQTTLFRTVVRVLFS